ncbi:MAG: AmmeMemoRadiSam system protein A [Spirochaetales bacterium]|nr:AmmeMemoRadiSam system protein A [Spirochaetales bacterium]
MDRDLLLLARNEILKELKLPYNDIKIKKDWNEKLATFVTLTKNGNLRGCIGSLIPTKPLYQDIKYNSIQSAFYDPRFEKLSENELDQVKIEISLLSSLKQMKFKSEQDLINQLIPFRMGLILEYGFHRGTFLPQVWEYYPNPKDFFNHLKIKAGLPIDFYNKNMIINFYEVEKCSE